MEAGLTVANLKEITKMPICLGSLARDIVTGFEGVVICETQWLHGCRRLTLQPRELKDGKVVDHCTFDEPQLELVTAAVVNFTKDTGGPRPEPRQAESPARF